jgi:hypothetical protein
MALESRNQAESASGADLFGTAPVTAEEAFQAVFNPPEYTKQFGEAAEGELPGVGAAAFVEHYHGGPGGRLTRIREIEREQRAAVATGKPVPLTNPEHQKAWEEDTAGIKKDGWKQHMGEMLVEARDKIFNRAYQHLPSGGRFEIARHALLRLQDQRPAVEDATDQGIFDVFEFLTPDERALAFQKIFADNWVHTDLEQLPYFDSPQEFEAWHEKVNESVEREAYVREALERRRALWNKVVGNYVEAMEAIGIDQSDKFRNPDYVRHQVLAYYGYAGLQGVGKRFQPARKRSFFKRRTGLDQKRINLDVVQADFEVLRQLMYDNAIAQTWGQIEAEYDIKPELENQLAGIKSGNLRLMPEPYQKAGVDPETVELEDLIPEDYELVPVNEGNVFFTAYSIPERAAMELFETGMLDAGLEPEDVRKILAVGGQFRQVVLPTEIAETFRDMGSKKPAGAWSRTQSGALKAWKVWQLISPRRFGRYNVRNITGDADKIFAGNPRAFKKVPRAIRDLRHHMKTGEASPELAAWLGEGGMRRLLQVQEMGDVKKLDRISALYETGAFQKILDKALFGYWRGARKYTDYREAILRYAAFLDYRQSMLEHPEGTPRNFGASVPEEVLAHDNVDVKAFKLANELIGAYEQLGRAGQNLRRYWFPFWSFQEVNMRSYSQLIKNAAANEELMSSVGRKMAFTAAVKSPILAARGAALMVRMSGLWAMTQAWNHIVFGDIEDELPDDIRGRFHVIFGKRDDDVLYFSRLGALGDLLEWVGLDTPAATMGDILDGRTTIGEAIWASVRAPIDKVANGITPYLKMPVELAAGLSFYPEVSRPRTIRSRARHVAQSLGLQHEYDLIMKEPSRGYWRSLRMAGPLPHYRVDPNASGYWEFKGVKAKFLKELGKGGSGGGMEARDLALYNVKRSVALEDRDALIKSLIDYKEYGGTVESAERAIDRLRPLEGLNKTPPEKLYPAFVRAMPEEVRQAVASGQMPVPSERQLFLMTLDEKEKAMLTRALKHYINLRDGNSEARPPNNEAVASG